MLAASDLGASQILLRVQVRLRLKHQYAHCHFVTLYNFAHIFFLCLKATVNKL